MPQQLSDWIHRINKREIPIFKSTVTSISRLAASDQASTSELASAILRDPALTARILKFANSPLYASSGTTTSTITRALVLLGFKSVRELSLSLAIIDSLVSSTYRTQLQELMAHTFHAAVQVRGIAEMKGLASTEEMFIATMLMNLGEMAFYCTATEEEIAALREAEQRPGISPNQAQRQTLGFAFKDLTQRLVADWKVSPTLITFLGNPEGQDSKSKCIRLGWAFVKSLTEGWNSEETAKVTREIAAFTNSSSTEAREALIGGSRTAAEIARDYGAQEFLRLIPGNEENTAKESDAGSAPLYPPPDPALQLKVLRELSSIMRSKPDINLAIEILLEAIHRGVGMDRAVFALYVPVRSHIRAKYVLGIDAETLMEHFTFPVDIGIGNPFSEVLFGNGAGLWVKNVLDSGFSQLVTSQIRDILGAKTFFLSPILVKNRPIGLFYADRHPSRRPLDTAAFECFEHMGQQACLALEHIMNQDKKTPTPTERES